MMQAPTDTRLLARGVIAYVLLEAIRFGYTVAWDFYGLYIAS